MTIGGFSSFHPNSTSINMHADANSLPSNGLPFVQGQLLIHTSHLDSTFVIVQSRQRINGHAEGQMDVLRCARKTSCHTRRSLFDIFRLQIPIGPRTHLEKLAQKLRPAGSALLRSEYCVIAGPRQPSTQYYIQRSHATSDDFPEDSPRLIPVHSPFSSIQTIRRFEGQRE